jgi:preprotein translocase subunit SecG
MVVILVIHCLIAAGLVGAILLQKKEAGLGGLGGGSGGMGGMMSGRAKSDLLSRTTGVLAALFFVTSLALAIIGAHSTRQGPLVPAASSGTVAPAAPAAPAAGGAEGTAPVESAPESAPAQPATQPTTPTVPAGQ